jgi:hypothetical protein
VDLSRRTLLRGLFAMPAVVAVQNIMPVRLWVPPKPAIIVPTFEPPAGVILPRWRVTGRGPRAWVLTSGVEARVPGRPRDADVKWLVGCASQPGGTMQLRAKERTMLELGSHSPAKPVAPARARMAARRSRGDGLHRPRSRERDQRHGELRRDGERCPAYLESNNLAPGQIVIWVNAPASSRAS